MSRSSWQPAALTSAGVGGWDFGAGRDTEEPQPGLLFAAEVEEFERREREAGLAVACGCDTQQDVLWREAPPGGSSACSGNHWSYDLHILWTSVGLQGNGEQELFKCLNVETRKHQQSIFSVV